MVNRPQALPVRPGVVPRTVGLRIALLVILGAVSVGFPTWEYLRGGLNGDMWWVWRAGQWMVVHHQVLLREPSLWTGPALAGRPWANPEWGWELILYLASPQGGILGFLVLLLACETLLLAAFWWTMHVIAPKLPIHRIAGLYALYAVAVAPIILRLRAEMGSYILFTLLLGVLWQSRTRPRRLWLLAPMTLVWANLHGSWLTVPALVGLELVDSVLRRDKERMILLLVAGWAVPLGIVVALTPEHWYTLTYALWMSGNPQILAYIQEWGSVNFHVATFLAMGAAVLVGWMLRARRRIRYPWLLDVWMVGITLFFFRETRMVAYFGIVFLLWCGYGLAQRGAARHARDEGPVAFRRWFGLAVATGVVTSILVLPFGSALAADHPSVPPAVVHWIDTHPHQGIFNPYRFGGYLLAHNVHDIFIDGRTDFYLKNSHRFQWYIKIAHGTVTPKQMVHMFARNQISWIVWPSSSWNAVLGWFVATEHWHRIYTAHGWEIWAKPSN